MKYLKIEDGEVGDSLEVIMFENGNLSFEIDKPWAGDSENGFGITANISITKEKAIELKEFLNKLLP